MKFQGFSSPHTTPTPNELYDQVMADITSLAELKVIMYVIRHTFGWGKFVDRISLTQFMHGIKTRHAIQDGDTLKIIETTVDRGTGLSQPSVTAGVRQAVQHGYLTRYLVCGRCDQEILEDQPPAKCPFCHNPCRGRHRYYYGLPLLSTELSTVPKQVRLHYLKDLGGTRKDLLVALPNLLCPQETTDQETTRQERIDQETTPLLLVTLSDLGFDLKSAKAIAQDADAAGLDGPDLHDIWQEVQADPHVRNPMGYFRTLIHTKRRQK